MSEPLNIDELQLPEEWYWEDEIREIDPPDWLIEDTIPERSVNMLFGEFNLGKTFLALDWAACVSAGLPWVGHDTKRRDVLYIASEGDPGGLGSRMKAWRLRWKHPDLPLRVLFYADMVDLMNIQHLMDAAIDRGLRPGLVIVDTLAMAMSEGENDNTAMTAVVKACRRAQTYTVDGEKFETAFLLVHHTGWTDDDRPRGGSSMPGGLDYIIGMKPGRAKNAIDVWLYKAKRSNKADWGLLSFRIAAIGEDAAIELYDHSELERDAAIEQTSGTNLRVKEYLLEGGLKRGDIITQVAVCKWLAEQENRSYTDFKGLMSIAFKALKDIGYLSIKPGTKAVQVALNPLSWFENTAEQPEEM